MPTRPAPARARVATSTCRCRAAPGSSAGAQALRQGLAAIGEFGATALVVAAGVDTFEGDPISGFRLRSADYLQIGHDIAEACAGQPLVWVFEGGYAVAEIGVNLANLLQGAAAAH